LDCSPSVARAAIAAGVRRIEALTGLSALDRLRSELQSQTDKLDSANQQLVDLKKAIEKERAQALQREADQYVRNLDLRSGRIVQSIDNVTGGISPSIGNRAQDQTFRRGSQSYLANSLIKFMFWPTLVRNSRAHCKRESWSKNSPRFWVAKAAGDPISLAALGRISRSWPKLSNGPSNWFQVRISRLSLVTDTFAVKSRFPLATWNR